MMDYNKTGDLIQTLRKEKGLTQLQLAEKLGVTDRAVSKWERGKSFPDVGILKELADELGISVTELIDGEQRPAYAEITAGEAEIAAIRGIKAYTKQFRGRFKMLIAALAIAILMLGAVGVYEYMEYSKQPVNFQNDKLDFDTIIYTDPQGEVHELELTGSFGEEVKGQLVKFLQERMVADEEVDYRLDMHREYYADNGLVELEGLALFFEECYYDYKSEKFYTSKWSSTVHSIIKSICEDLVADIEYKYEGPVHFENEFLPGKTLDINCTLNEKPMELIIEYFEEMTNSYYPDMTPGAYESFTITNIRRLAPEEYLNASEWEFIEKEIAYRDIYNYRVYLVDVISKQTDAYKALGPQYKEGEDVFLFMVSKERTESTFCIGDNDVQRGAYNFK